MKQKIIGIYKVTSPKSKIYIGQSIDIERRFKEYKRLAKSSIGIKLYNSFQKHGVENHTLEIIEECSLDYLNDCEYKWKIHFNSVETGLNCYYKDQNTRRGIKDSDETRLKKSIALKGLKRSEETKMKMRNPRGKQSVEACMRKSIAAKGKLLGFKQSASTIEKRNQKLRGQKRSEETKDKLRIPKSEETKLNMSAASKLRCLNKVVCPHCLKEGSKSIMNRWHFDRCKYKEQQ